MKPQPSDVTLVIPGKNAERTIVSCLDAAVPLLGSDGLKEIIFVDDGSTDRTPEVVGTYPVTCLKLDGKGPGAARNLGWRAATSPLIWFMDADCVVEPDALGLLLPHLEAPEIAGVGGSYGNIETDSILARLIHAEIRERHLSMEADVNYLGSFNVVYRREVLESAGGFDEEHFNAPGAPGAEDADLSYRIAAMGYHLRLEPRALTGHHHPTRLRPYLRSQRLHGYWGARLYARHREMALGNSYSSFVDHIQPAVAVAALVGLPGLASPRFRLLSLALLIALFVLQIPMTGRLLRRTGSWQMLGFAPLAMIRGVARGIGMSRGLLQPIMDRLKPPPEKLGLKCGICGADGAKRLYGLPSGAIVRCAGCHTVRRENLVSGDDAVRLYEDESYLDTPYFEALKVGAPRDVEPYLVYRRVLRMLESVAPKQRLLDVGASYGAFLELASERGWDTYGVELAKKGCAYAASERGLTMHNGTLSEASFPDGHFSVVTLWDLIEHLDEPRAFLEEATRILAPDGVLMVFTINQKSLINRIGHLLYSASLRTVKRPLVLLYDIHHNFFFDRGTLTSLLRTAGFAGNVEFAYMDAKIDRWQNVPIPPILAFGSKCLDAVSRIIGGRYRMIVFASASPSPHHGV